MSPFWKIVGVLIFFIFTWGFIIDGTIGVFFLVRDFLTLNNTGVAIGATVVFMFSAIMVGEKLAQKINCLLAKLAHQDAPSCVKKENGN
ncbi:MAG: hypothetical protein ACC641_01925 [Acidiferrobacterales bacterium]